MKDKWNTDSNSQENANKRVGQPVGLLYSYDSTQWNRPAKAPSTRAIFNYNNIELETPVDGNVNYIFSGDEDSLPVTATPKLVPKIDDDKSTDKITPPLVQGQMMVLDTAESRLSDTPTLEGSAKTNFTVASTSNLVELSTVNFHTKFHSWMSSLERGLSCVSLAASFGNVSRLPSMVAQHGGAPFLVAYVILLVLVGAPLIFLELGIGQIVQQGVSRTWRAVPMIRGVAYIKLIINMIVCIYYPLYIGLALFYLLWLSRGRMPFIECATAKMTASGYQAFSIKSEDCLNKTFLESPLYDPKWFGIYTGLLAVIWIVIMLCSYRRIKAYMRSMNCFFIPVCACLIALTVKAIQTLDQSFLNNIDWSLLKSADVWYYATIQLFFSTHLGFGNVVTCAGKVYNKADPFWAAQAYIIVNIILGIFSVSICYLLMGEALQTPKSTTTELYIFVLIYEYAVHHRAATSWTVVAYLTIFLSGFISVLAAVFTVLKAIRIETKSNWLWWHTAAFTSFIFFILGTFSILVPSFQIVHILDHYVVGNLLLFCTLIEVSAFVYIYGSSNLYLDFEFILGSKLNIIWKILWWLAPVILLIVTISSFATVRLTGVFVDDPDWIYIAGWSSVVMCIITILIIAIYEIYIQVDYNIIDKVLSSLKPSRKWGPVDPMIRHGWIQWRSTAGTSGRDFTLKRRGTRDYTHSVKNRRDTTGKYTSTLTTTSDNVTLRAQSTPTLSTGEQNGKLRHTLELISITDTLERQDNQTHLEQRLFNNPDHNYENINPLNVPSTYGDTTTTTVNESNSEGYGTIRNGPYVIANGDFDHVCWRKSEEATEL